MIQGAVLYAKELDRLVTFYSMLGGNVVDAQPGEYAVLQGSNTELSIVQSPKHIASEIQITTPPAVRTNTALKLMFLVPSINQALASALQLGGITEPDAKRWEFRGHLIQDAVDPEGNVYQLCQPNQA